MDGCGVGVGVERERERERDVWSTLGLRDHLHGLNQSERGKERESVVCMVFNMTCRWRLERGTHAHTDLEPVLDADVVHVVDHVALADGQLHGVRGTV